MAVLRAKHASAPFPWVIDLDGCGLGVGHSRVRAGASTPRLERPVVAIGKALRAGRATLILRVGLAI